MNSNLTPEQRETAKSGDACPKSGMWEVIGIFSTQMIIRQGAIMPLYGGRTVAWKLLYPC